MRKVKLLFAKDSPPGFINEQVEVTVSNYESGFALRNPKLSSCESLELLDQILFELELEKKRIIKQRHLIASKPFDRFRPKFPFLIEV